MKALLDLTIDYTPDDAGYQNFLTRNGVEDSLESFIRWGLDVQFWRKNIPFEVIEVQNDEQKEAEE